MLECATKTRCLGYYSVLKNTWYEMLECTAETNYTYYNYYNYYRLDLDYAIF